MSAERTDPTTLRQPVRDADTPAGDACKPGRGGDNTGRAWLRYGVGMAVVAVVAAVLGSDAYLLTLVTSAVLFAGLASAWNILGGFGGQFSLGHAVFFGVGAYSVALLQTRVGVSPWVGMAVGVAAASVLAVLLAWPIFRLRGPFFAIATLALTAVALALANFFTFTGGPRGVSIPFTESLFIERGPYLWLMFGYLAVVVAVAQVIARGRLGYSLFAVRDDEEAAKASGINPLTVKTVALLISAALTAVGGALFTMYIGFINPPSVFSIAEVSVRIPLLALLGGLGTLSGPVIGALVFQMAADYLRGEYSDVAPGAHLIILGVFLVLFALFFKNGIRGALVQLWRRYVRR